MQIQICMNEFSSDEQSKIEENVHTIIFFSFLKPNDCKQDMLPLENDRVIQ